MNDIIYPRSPRETMCGWMHLPRYIDKIRLHLAGRLHEDYQPNFGKGFDGMWLSAAGFTHSDFVELVSNTICDGQIADWVAKNCKASQTEKDAHAAGMFDYPKAGDEAAMERLRLRKKQAGLAHRDDIKVFVDFIDADEHRI